MPGSLRDLTRSRLYEWALRADRHLGQHFLVADWVLQRIVEAADLSEQDWVLEVGAGLGFLTEELCLGAGRVTSLEVDPQIHGMLTRELAHLSNLDLRLTPFSPRLMDDWLAEVDEADLTPKLVANLPYQITGLFLEALLERLHRLRLAVVMLQREVVQRMLARPGGKSYSSLTVVLRTFGSAELVCRVPPGAFLPPPRVESAVVRLRPGGEVELPPDFDRAGFQLLVRAAFKERRKKLVNSLHHSLPGASRELITEALTEAGLDPDLRAEKLSPQEFVTLYRAVAGRLQRGD